MKAPEIKHYINWLGRVEYRNINCSFTYDETSYAAIDRIFHLLHRLEPGPENTSWELWLRAERGTDADYWPLIQANERMLNAGVDVNHFEPVTFEEMEANNLLHKGQSKSGLEVQP